MTSADRMTDLERREGMTPKTLTLLREGYSLSRLQADALAGLTVAIVALPLSMAIAIASGVSPERGLFTAIVGGFIVSLLGGSRFQIGGPAGAFIVLVGETVALHGLDGLFLATMMAGVMLVALGLFRLGGLIRLVPHSVTAGFTAGIGAIILVSQLRDLLGLTLAGPEPGGVLEKVPVLAAALPGASPAAIGLSALTIVLVTTIRRLHPALPSLLIAVVAGTALASLLDLPIDTVLSRFGPVPSMLPPPALPPVSTEKALAVLPSAIAIALLGGIESLLSAVVADRMGERRHRPDIELAAQGVANIVTPLFGGITVTGTIARTATNVRAGATSPVAGMLHAVFLAGLMLAAAPLLGLIPLPVLAGILAVVAWNMLEFGEGWRIARVSRLEGAAFAATCLLTVLVDLVAGIAVGAAMVHGGRLMARLTRR
jgi:SulP family sulfate permease